MLDVGRLLFCPLSALRRLVYDWLFGLRPDTFNTDVNVQAGRRLNLFVGDPRLPNNLKQYGRWAFAEFTKVYQIETDFKAKVEGEFNKMIEGLIKENGRDES